MKLSNAVIALLVMSAVTASVPAGAGTVLPGLDPNYVSAQHSISSDSEAAILFNNQSGFDVDIYWIDYSGNPVLYETILAGGSFLQQTFLTHPWLVKAHSSSVALMGFIPVTGAPWGTDNDIANITDPPTPVQNTTWGAIKALLR